MFTPIYFNYQSGCYQPEASFEESKDSAVFENFSPISPLRLEEPSLSETEIKMIADKISDKLVKIVAQQLQDFH